VPLARARADEAGRGSGNRFPEPPVSADEVAPGRRWRRPPRRRRAVPAPAARSAIGSRALRMSA